MLTPESSEAHPEAEGRGGHEGTTGTEGRGPGNTNAEREGRGMAGGRQSEAKGKVTRRNHGSLTFKSRAEPGAWKAWESKCPQEAGAGLHWAEKMGKA